MPAFKDITGQRFGRLVIIRRYDYLKPNWRWLCKCDCGETTIVFGCHLRTGRTQSCGCLRKDLLIATYTKHGNARKDNHSLEYERWTGMLSRCRNPNRNNYNNYGGRGIKVCKRWHKFENFLADMGRCPPGMTLDRYPDRDGDYKPSNCRWATKKQQRNNQRPRNRPPRSMQRIQIIAALREKRAAMTIKGIAIATNQKYDNCKRLLLRMSAYGDIIRVERGYYAVHNQAR